MSKEIVEALVKGGEATAAPPLGPALGPLGVKIDEVINQINAKTLVFKGMEVPVKVIVDSETKKFTISVGTPPVTAMLKQEMKVKKLATILEGGVKNLPGDIKIESIIKIAKCKEGSIPGNLKARVKQILGTCLSSGVTVDGKSPRDVQKEIDEGKIKLE
ncbi:MAG: 50S ribosomal protein L11 [Candidatus Aenigmarchaeota archaeon]|nr:50S ribosomal protein L11 [Candidatus Aenigmarchaeota archaeon]